MGKEHTIVVVDDNELMRILVCRTLSEEGYRVIGLDNPFEAPRVIHRERPALVLLDVQMPGLSGPRLLEICKGQEYFKQTVFFFHSALDRGSLLELTLSSGAHGYVQKPWTRSVLLERVREGLERYNQLLEHQELPTWHEEKTANGFQGVESFARHEEGSALRFTRVDHTTQKVHQLIDELENAHAKRDAESVETLALQLRDVQVELEEDDAERLETFLELFGY